MSLRRWFSPTREELVRPGVLFRTGLLWLYPTFFVPILLAEWATTLGLLLGLAWFVGFPIYILKGHHNKRT